MSGTSGSNIIFIVALACGVLILAILVALSVLFGQMEPSRVPRGFQWLAAHGRIQEERSIIWLTQPPWELGATGAGEKGERKLGPRPAMWEVCACEQQQQQESGLGSAGFAAAGGGNGLDGNMIPFSATLLLDPPTLSFTFGGDEDEDDLKHSSRSSDLSTPPTVVRLAFLIAPPIHPEALPPDAGDDPELDFELGVVEVEVSGVARALRNAGSSAAAEGAGDDALST